MQNQTLPGIRYVLWKHPKRFCAEESSLRKACAITFTLLIFCALSSGQLPRSGNAFFGYSYSTGRVFNGAGIGINMSGWEGALEGKFLPWLGGVADFDWHYGGAETTCISFTCQPGRFRLNGSRHSILFGPRASTTVGKYTPFAQVLFGLTHQTDAGPSSSTSDMSFAYAVGGGLDYQLLKSVSWRAQVDRLRTNLFAGAETEVRVSTGIVFRF
jgi:opacity protein-like surface antigen